MIDRFTEKVEKSPNGCWLWTAACFSNGYGAFRVGNRQRRAHRWAYEQFVGTLPDDAVVMHTCDTPRCVNPDHLRLGTHADNVTDRVEKGRSATGERVGAVLHPIKLNLRLAEEIRETYRRDSVPQQALALRYGVSQTMISKIIRQTRWPTTR